jgi:hypothetical protein
MPASSPKETPPAATFIFQGTVQRAKSAAMKNVEVNDQTIVVTVDQVLEAPKSLAKFGGNEITVQLSGRQKAEPGQTMIFHTNGWIFGDSVAVQCVKLEEVKRSHAGLLNRGGDPVEHRRNQVVQKRFADADTVVSGTVAIVKLPGASAARGRSMRAVDEPVVTGPISEHNPHWREAVITIDEKHKGSAGQNEMVIQFPSSTDVRWFKAPKFTPGQQGYFMLRKTKVSKKGKVKKAAKGARAMRGVATETLEAEEVYTALHPEDFQPYSDPGGIKRILDSSGDETDG